LQAASPRPNLFQVNPICPESKGRPVFEKQDRIVRLETVLDRTGLSRATVYRKIGEGTFPRQIRISVHGAGWRESAINQWIENPVAYRESDTARN
jgi:prophage regulatory protein